MPAADPVRAPFRGPKEPERMPIRARLEQRRQAWLRAGGPASEMESAAPHIVRRVREPGRGASRVRPGTGSGTGWGWTPRNSVRRSNPLDGQIA